MPVGPGVIGRHWSSLVVIGCHWQSSVFRRTVVLVVGLTFSRGLTKVVHLSPKAKPRQGSRSKSAFPGGVALLLGKPIPTWRGAGRQTAFPGGVALLPGKPIPTWRGAGRQTAFPGGVALLPGKPIPTWRGGRQTDGFPGWSRSSAGEAYTDLAGGRQTAFPGGVALLLGGVAVALAPLVHKLN